VELHPRLEVVVAARRVDRSGSVELDLRPRFGNLPAFTAGAHVQMFLPNGLIRSYSLMNNQDERHRYVCGVGLDRNSRGGSSYIHEAVVEGSLLTISEPNTLFPLHESAKRSVLFAGGIGVTPLVSMARRLTKLGRDWTLVCCARSRDTTPFFDQLADFGARVAGRFDDECPGLLDFAEAMTTESAAAHFYCCGPTPMIDAFEAAAAIHAPGRSHTERFTAEEAAATDGGFTVVLARSGLSIPVTSGKTILEAIEDAGVEVPFSCLSGICGSCVTKVLEGVPDHRDMVLTDRERGRNDQMMICCSGSLTPRLVLDR
jgi:ferredoxin-NADP reductase